jgi:type VI secretion system protein ImpJ
MSSNNKVICTEGMFLRPVHFQQFERYFQSWIEFRCNVLQCYSWGVTKLEINEALLLAEGKLEIMSCLGVFPDGTPFSAAPEPIIIPVTTEDEIFYLSLPRNGNISSQDKSQNAQELSWEENPTVPRRYFMKEITIKDVHSQSGQTESIVQSGVLSPLIRSQSQKKGDFADIPIARVIKNNKGLFELSNQFIPTSLHVGSSSKLINYVKVINGLLKLRGDSLAEEIGKPGTGGVAEIREFLLLQIINRYEPLFQHFSKLEQLHPERLFSVMIQMAGELATITTTERRSKILEQFYIDKELFYNHDDLYRCFNPIFIVIQETLNIAIAPRAIKIELKPQENKQIRHATIHEKSLLDSARFILAVRAQISADKIQQHFPQQTVIATPNQLEKLVKVQRLGIKLKPLGAAPEEIPFHQGMTYFILERNSSDQFISDLWKELEVVGIFAWYFSDQAYPGLELEFWAIRGEPK